MQFTHTIDDAVVPNITAAREEFNSAPAAGSAPGGGSPSPFTTNDAFLAFVMDDMVRTWVKKYGLLPPTLPATPTWYQCSRAHGLMALARAPQVGLPAPIYEADIQLKIDGMPTTSDAEKLKKLDTNTKFHNDSVWIRGNYFFESLVGAMGIKPDQRDALLQLAATFAE
jgi:hypothetical protein